MWPHYFHIHFFYWHHTDDFSPKYVESSWDFDKMVSKTEKWLQHKRQYLNCDLTTFIFTSFIDITTDDFSPKYVESSWDFDKMVSKTEKWLQHKRQYLNCDLTTFIFTSFIDITPTIFPRNTKNPLEILIKWFQKLKNDCNIKDKT